MQSIILCQLSFDHNVSYMKSFIAGQGILAFVVKANAYGHGFAEMVFLAEQNPLVDWFCVFHLSEAIAMRALGGKKPILVMGDWDASVSVFEDVSIVPMIDTIEAAKTINTMGQTLGKKLCVHVKIDTGLSRFGISPDEVNGFFTQLADLSYLSVQGIYTHFSQSQLKDQSYTDYQMAAFKDAVKVAKNIIGSIRYIHAYNSAATMIRSSQGCNFFRIGLGLYGYYSSDFARLKAHESRQDALQPVLSIASSVIRVKNIKKGSYIGYNNEALAEQDMKIGLVPFGYYDGYEPAFKGISCLQRGEYIFPILGRIAMNVIAIDMTAFDGFLAKDFIVFLSSRHGNTAQMLCQQAHITNVRTFLSRLNPFIKRKICTEKSMHKECLLGLDY